MWWLGAVALAVADSAWAFEVDERQDSAVAWMSYEPAQNRLTGTVMSGHVDFMAGPQGMAGYDLRRDVQMHADASYAEATG